jgi:hypothetical protein
MLVMEMVGARQNIDFTIKRVDQVDSTIQSGLSSKWRRVSLRI